MPAEFLRSVFNPGMPTREESRQRDKRKNTIDFNIKVKKRREKAKFAAKSRKRNQK